MNGLGSGERARQLYLCLARASALLSFYQFDFVRGPRRRGETCRPLAPSPALLDCMQRANNSRNHLFSISPAPFAGGGAFILPLHLLPSAPSRWAAAPTKNHYPPRCAQGCAGQRGRIYCSRARVAVRELQHALISGSGPMRRLVCARRQPKRTPASAAAGGRRH